MISLLEKNGGVVERLAGDCIMAMFGPPIARQRQDQIDADAVAAVRYACQMDEVLWSLNEKYRDENLPEMRVGIGIHSGELVGCSLGNAERQQYATIGDTTNTAARLMSAAKELMQQAPGDKVTGIVVSERTRGLLHGAFDLRPLGPVACKGKKQRIECYVLHTGRHDDAVR
jgi:adenylate cyclase